jgi:hypothetical protein
MPARIIPGRSKYATGIKGKNKIIKTTKIIESTKAMMKTDGINITNAAAIIINAKYAAIYPPTLVICLPFMVMVVPAKKWITDTSSNMLITISSIFFFFIVINSVYKLTNTRVSLSAKRQPVRTGIFRKVIIQHRAEFEPAAS